MLEGVDHDSNIKLVIKRDSKVGYYMFVYNLTYSELIEDRLYDTLEEVLSAAERNYGFKKDNFEER